MSSLVKYWELAVRILILSVIGLSACQPTLVPQSEPSLVIFHISITPTLNTLRPLMKTCIDKQPNVSLVISETQTPQGNQNSLAIQWGAHGLASGFAASVGEEELVFIVHPQNPLNNLSLADLQTIYTGMRQEWPGSSPAGEIQAWAYPANTDIQQIFAELADDPPFPANVTYLAPDPQAMLEAVAASPPAVGFIPRRWLDDRVRVIQIDGLAESSVRQPILSISETEPEGPKKSWLLCLQAGLTE